MVAFRLISIVQHGVCIYLDYGSSSGLWNLQHCPLQSSLRNLREKYLHNKSYVIASILYMPKTSPQDNNAYTFTWPTSRSDTVLFCTTSFRCLITRGPKFVTHCNMARSSLCYLSLFRHSQNLEESAEIWKQGADAGVSADQRQRGKGCNPTQTNTGPAYVHVPTMEISRCQARLRSDCELPFPSNKRISFTLWQRQLRRSKWWELHPFNSPKSIDDVSQWSSIM